MTEKHENSTKTDEIQFSKEILDAFQTQITQFAETYNPAELKPQTQPSIMAVEGTRAINLVKLDPKIIEQYLWSHPVIPRGIEMKANRMVRRGYSILPKGKDAKAIEASEYCNNILENSGGNIFINRWIKDAYSFGNGYWTLVPNRLGNAIVKLNPEHPVFFRPNFEDATGNTYNPDIKFDINPKNKEIASFTQVKFKDTNPDCYEKFGKPIDAKYVAHLMFDRYGDEPIGISIMQYIFLNIKYCLNLEEAAAERLWRDGFPRQKITTEITNEKDLKKLAKNISNINAKDALILPKGMNADILISGTSDFPAFHKIFLQLLSIKLGIPLPLLVNDGTSTNKATLDEERKDMMADFSMDEEIIEHTIINKIFKPACELKYGKDFPYVPDFMFDEIPENETEKVDRFNKTSTAISNISGAIKSLTESGISLDDIRIINLLNYLNESVIDARSSRNIDPNPIIDGQEEESIPVKKQPIQENPNVKPKSDTGPTKEERTDTSEDVDE